MDLVALLISIVVGIILVAAIPISAKITTITTIGLGFGLL